MYVHTFSITSISTIKQTLTCITYVCILLCRLNTTITTLFFEPVCEICFWNTKALAKMEMKAKPARCVFAVFYFRPSLQLHFSYEVLLEMALSTAICLRFLRRKVSSRKREAQ